MDDAGAPIFVVGSGRSGTSLLRAMLNAHPNVHLTHEASFYLDPRGRSHRRDGLSWFDRYRRSFSFAWLGVPADAVTDRLSGMPGASRRHAIATVMALAARARGAARFGDKTPAHAQHLREIVADFPDARIVHVVRDPRWAVASLARMPWAAAGHGLNAQFWRRQVEAVVGWGGAVCEVRLEDLVAEPEVHMRRVLAFVGEPWDAAVLEHGSQPGVDDVPPFPWFASATRPLRPARSTTPDLDPAWVRLVERLGRPTMQRFGYAPLDLPDEPSPTALRRALLVDARQGAATVARAARVAALAVRDRIAADEMQTAVLSLNPDAWSHYPGFEVPPVPAVASGGSAGG